MQIAEAARLSRTVLDVLQQVIVGKEQVLQHLLLGLYSGGNILIEDFPGLAKTLTARLVAQVTGLEFKRIQFTPDLLPGRDFGWQATHDATCMFSHTHTEEAQQSIEGEQQHEALPVVVEHQIQRHHHQDEEGEHAGVVEQARRGRQRFRHVPHACGPVRDVH